MYEVKVLDTNDGRVVIGAKCPRCGEYVPAQGLPVYLGYTSDTRRKFMAQGMMLVKPHRFHKLLCPEQEEGKQEGAP